MARTRRRSTKRSRKTRNALRSNRIMHRRSRRTHRRRKGHRQQRTRRTLRGGAGDKELATDKVADKASWMERVKKNAYVLRDAPEYIKSDKDIVKAAVAKQTAELDHASDELKKDKPFILDLINTCEQASKEESDYSIIYENLGPTLSTDKDIILKLVEHNGWIFSMLLDVQLFMDKEIVIAAVSSYGKILEEVNVKFKIDKDVVKAAVTNDGEALHYASQELQDDKEIVLKAVANTTDRYLLTSVSKRLRADRGIVMAAVLKNGEALEVAPPELQADREIVLAAVSQDGEALRYASPDLQADRDIVMAAVLKNGEALEVAPPELQADREIVLAAITQNMEALRYASPELRVDKDIIQEALDFDNTNKRAVLAKMKEGIPLKYICENLRGDRDVVLAAVSHDGRALQLASPELQADKNVVLAAVKHDKEMYLIASEELQRDKDIIREALDFDNTQKQDVLAQVTQDIRKILFIPQEWLNDPEIKQVIMSKIDHNINTLTYISPEDPTYKDYARYALQRDSRALAYIHGVAMEDPTVSCYTIPYDVRQELTEVPSPEEWLQLGIKSPDILRFFPYQYREDPLLMEAYQETHRRFFAGAYVKQSQPGVYPPYKGRPFRMGIELECCGKTTSTSFSNIDCLDVIDLGGFEHVSHLFEMVVDKTVNCPRGQCMGEIIVRPGKTLMFDGDMYQVPPDEDTFLDNLKHIGDTFHPSYGDSSGEGGRFQVHISAPELPYGNPEGLQFAKTLLCLWAMDRTDGTYQDRFTLMGHSDDSGARRPPYKVITKSEMEAQFQNITPGNAPEQSEEDNPYESFRQFIVSKLKWLTSSNYGGMFFYSLFEHMKYAERPDDLMRPVRLEFRGFHNVLRIAHSLAQLKLSDPHILAGQSPGDIFKTYVHQHMKDVHFFFDLAYKTSGSNPLYADAMKMVRGGDSLDAIIGKVAALEEQDKKSWRGLSRGKWPTGRTDEVKTEELQWKSL